MIEGHDSNSKKATRLINELQWSLIQIPNPETYLNEVCTALKDIGKKPITDIVNELERKLRLDLSTSVNVSSFI